MRRHGKMLMFMTAMAASSGLPPVVDYYPRQLTTPLGRRQQAHRVGGSKRRGRRVSNRYFAKLLGALTAALLLSGCVDIETPLPIDGQVYLCTFSDARTSERLFEVERCGPWNDWTVPADELAAEYVESGAPREVNIDCRGTRRACAWTP